MYTPDKSIENNDIIVTIEDNDIFNSSILRLITEAENYSSTSIGSSTRLDLVAKESNSSDTNLSIGLIGVINKVNVFNYNRSDIIKYINKETYKEIIKNA